MLPKSKISLRTIRDQYSAGDRKLLSKLFLKGISQPCVRCSFIRGGQGRRFNLLLECNVHKVLGEVRFLQMLQYPPSRNGKENRLIAILASAYRNINGTWTIQGSFNYHHCLIMSSSPALPLSSQPIAMCCQACRNSVLGFWGDLYMR